MSFSIIEFAPGGLQAGEAMSEWVEFWEKPGPGRCMIAGWHQWADAGSVSSGLPQYLVNYTGARLFPWAMSGSKG